MNDDTLESWSESAGSAGDAETMLIAEIALGRQPDLEPYSRLGKATLDCLAAMTPAQARTIAEGW